MNEYICHTQVGRIVYHARRWVEAMAAHNSARPDLTDKTLGWTLDSGLVMQFHVKGINLDNYVHEDYEGE